MVECSLLQFLMALVHTGFLYFLIAQKPNFFRKSRLTKQWLHLVKLSKTRWWSQWAIYHQLLVQFGDIDPFLARNEDIGPSLQLKLLDMLTPEHVYKWS